MRAHAIVAIFLVAVMGVIACGGRTSPATQPTPAAFDPTMSDSKSVAAVDEMLKAVGGVEAWAAVKQLRWEQRYFYEGDMKAWTKHAWDMWNGRHRFDLADMSTYSESEPDKIKFSSAMYDIFRHDGNSGTALYGNREVGSDDRKRIIKLAWQHFGEQAYLLALPHKVKDPGVKLEYSGLNKDTEVKGVRTVCVPSCDVVKVTFVAEVGSDTYWVHINTKTKLPDIIEKRGKSGRIAYALDKWVDVKGLKFPQQFQNVGQTKEIFKIEKISIGSPDDTLYVPRVKPAG
jgi:hypothetical protein